VKRSDGRGFKALRPVKIRRNYLKRRREGTAVFEKYRKRLGHRRIFHASPFNAYPDFQGFADRSRKWPCL
jgi:hypothetical protein